MGVDTEASLPEEDFKAIVAAGLLAPSADNRHDIRFHLSGTTIELRASPDRAERARYRQVLDHIGIGAVIENMLLRAQRLGWVGRLQGPSQKEQSAIVARIDYTRIDARAGDLEAAIEDRHTNRRIPFRGPGLTPAQLEAFEHEAAGFANVRLRWLDERPIRKRVASIARLAEAQRLSSKALHRELFSSIRFDVGWKQSASSGLPPATLGIAGPMRPVFALLNHPRAAAAASRIGAHHLFGFRSGYLPCIATPHLAVIATSSEPLAGACAAGRALERIWLRATRLGFALQPLAAPAIYALAGCEEVPRAVNQALIDTWSDILPGLQPLILFRLGSAPGPTVRSERPTLRQHIG
jgi:hypothetical protein